MDTRLKIGIVGIADFRSVIGQDLIRGVLTAAEDYNVNCINCCSSIKHSITDDQSLYAHYRSYFQFMNRRTVDGLLSWASSFRSFMPDGEIISLHRSLGNLPTVALGLPLLSDVPGVFTDSEYDISLIMEHLVNVRKYRRVGFLGATNRPQYVRRLEAYKKWLIAHGMPVDESLVFLSDQYERNDVVKLVERIVREGAHKPPLSMDALITVSDIVAGYIITELEAHGLHVPEDIAVTGYNNQLESLTSSVPITTVDLCFYERGYRSVKLLIEAIEASRKTGSGKMPKSEYYPSRLVVRQSCGGFESIITDTGSQVPKAPDHSRTDCSRPDSLCADTIEGSAPGLKRAILNTLSAQVSGLTETQRESLADALISDYERRTERELLVFLRKFLYADTDHYTPVSQEWNFMLSVVRTVMLPFAAHDPDRETTRRMEDLFHQARVMLSLFDSYYISSQRYDAYEISSAGQLAIDFASANDIPDILRKTRSHLEKLSIQSVCLALQEEMTPAPDDCALVLVHPSETTDTEKTVLPKGNLPLRQLFGKNRASVVLKILFYRNSYIGYAVFGMGPRNIAVYDMFQAILSRSLYAAYIGRNSIRTENDTQLLLKTKKIQSILEQSENRTGAQGSLCANTIFEYLLNNLGEPTDLDRMAGDLGVSKSHLMRKTKTMTGYTIQVLHEMLKIERAVILLERASNANIGEISERLGFHNQSYFARVFRKHKGVSPLAWKKQN